MSCSCSNTTDIRGRCNPFDTEESNDCPMRIDSFFWFFENDRDYEHNFSKINVLNSYYSPVEAINIYTKFIVEKTLSEYIIEEEEDDKNKVNTFEFNQAYE
jgi:hypothetical protein